MLSISSTERITHPGVILRELLSRNGMSQKDLSATIGKTTPVINDILSGKRNINVEIAVLLESVFDEISAKEWLDYQSVYDISKTRVSPDVVEQQKHIQNWKSLGDIVNLNVLKKRVGLGKSNISDLTMLYELYGVSSVDALRNCISSYKNDKNGYFKKSSALNLDEVNLNTWILLTRIASRKKALTTCFSIDKIANLIAKLNDVFYHNNDTIIKIEKVLSEYGIKFVCVPKLEKVPVDGYSFWKGDNPTIIVTLRYKWLDNLAFTVFHELGHIVRHLSQNKNLDYLDIDLSHAAEDNREVEANEFATSAIWGDCDYKSIFRKIAQPFAAGAILSSLSERYRINEGIIVGQYQHYCSEKNISAAFAICNDRKQKIG